AASICCICSRRLMARSGVSLWCQCLTAIGGKADIARASRSCRSGAIDPTETWAAQDFRSAKALFVPSLKRDIVLPIACTRPPAGGVAWQSTSDGGISSRCSAARRRGRWLARAQQPERIRRIRVLMSFAESDPEAQARVAAFREGLQKLGWTEGRNIRIDTRWATANVELIQRFAKELLALQPELVLSATTPTTAALLQQTRTVPIIFAVVSDP